MLQKHFKYIRALNIQTEYMLLSLLLFSFQNRKNEFMDAAE